MIETRKQARDEMLARLKAVLDAAAIADLTVIYMDTRQDQPTQDASLPAVPPGRPWIRAGVIHNDGAAASLGGANRRRRFENTGLIYAQVFTPGGDGLDQSDEIVDAVLDGFRAGGSTPGGVQFTNERSEEIGTTGAWFQVNVVVDFSYDRFV